MTLATLVEYAQTSFGVPIPPADEPPDLTLPAPRLPPRPPIPDWLRTRRPEQDAPADRAHPWQIHDTVLPPLPPPNVDAVGADALAFYLPFHFYSDGWGIYIRESGVKYLACVLKDGALIPGDEHYLATAEEILYHHEMWHAAAEVACTRAELLARRSMYREYFRERDAAEHEEALANANAIRQCLRFPDAPMRSQLEHWMRRQGPGYSDYARWLKTPAFARGRNASARFMTRALPKPVPKVAGAPHDFLYRGAASYPSMPVARVLDVESSGASVVRPFPKEFGLQVFVYTRDHDPPHFHIFLPSEGKETRYLWPGLVPYEGDPRLTGSNEKAFRRYWNNHGQGIVAKLETVYQRGVG
ncbi:MAG: hypothetical protein HYU31_17035 [Deltaproteobacteria bacterium]|nr:hypothetical protein [Deltaproteobacteria bacterium]